MSRNSARESVFRAWLEDHGGIPFRIARAFARTPTDAADLHHEMKEADKHKPKED